MSSIHPSLDVAPGRGAALRALTLPVFALAIFTSAFLLFSVQPLFTKMVLPVLGGTPAVWSVAMVFFQGVLLAGYLYAHLLNRRLGPARAVIVHLALMVVVFVIALPIALAPGWGRPPADGEAFWLLGLFAASVGLPFFAIAETARFSRPGSPQRPPRRRRSLFLYGASNFGSFLALLSYPFLVEPLLALKSQSNAWTAGSSSLPR